MIQSKNSKIWLLSILVTALFIPQITFAAWWNPLSWGIFSSIFHNDSRIQITATTTPQDQKSVSATSSSQVSDDISTTSDNTNTVPVKQTPPVNKPVKIIKKTSQPETTSNVQATGTLCNGTYWNSCPTGQNIICPQTGNAYCQPPQQPVQSTPQTLASTTASTTISTQASLIDKGTPYKGQDGNWYYPNAYDANGRNLQLIIPDPKVTVTVNPTSVEYGGAATISWVAKGATSCTMNSSPVLLAPTGSQNTESLTTSTTYTFNCSYPDGTDSTNATVNVPQSSINYAIAAKNCYVAGITLYPQFPCLDQRNYKNIFPYSPSQFDSLPAPANGTNSASATVNVQPWVPPPGVKVLPAGQCSRLTAPCTTGPNGWFCSKDGCGG